jgi:hypothetical protein
MSALERTNSEEIVRVFSRRIRLARAAELASAGSLFRAEELLMPNGELPDSAEELDLLARILVRQKRYGEAQKRWNDAFRVSGGKSHYQDALNTLNYYLQALKWRRQILVPAVFVLILIIWIGIWYQFLR